MLQILIRLPKNLSLSSIGKKYPSHGILAEESGEIKNSSEFVWVIVPIDGTVNFAHGLPIFSVSIGLQKDGKTIAGMVYDVAQNIVYSLPKQEEVLMLIQQE